MGIHHSRRVPPDISLIRRHGGFGHGAFPEGIALGCPPGLGKRGLRPIFEEDVVADFCCRLCDLGGEGNQRHAFHIGC